MAPIESEVYLPPLDKCFSGQHQLLSWKSTYTVLSQIKGALNDSFLQKHLTSSHARHILSTPFTPFDRPTSQSKSSLETKTSAINVSPSPQGRYDIKQIQEDTLWLSKETQIDEVTALRIIILEWQSRPISKLLLGGPAESTAALNPVLGGNSLRLSQSLKLVGGSTQSNGKSTFSNDTEARRTRLLKLYLSERRYIIKTSEYVVFAALCQGASAGGKENPQEAITWIKDLGNAILSIWNIQELSKNTRRNFFVSAAAALQTRVDSLEKGSGWFKGEEFQEELELVWAESQLLEMTNILQLMLILLESTTDLPRSDAFLAWFRFMGTFAFFETFEPLYPGYQQTFSLPLQSLSSLVSLAMLQVPSALELLSQLSSTTIAIADAAEETPYLLNLSVVNEANNIFVESASVCLINASLAVLAWGVIMQTMRESALVSKGSRELRQSQRAVDKYSSTEMSDTDSGETFSQQQAGSVARHSSAGNDTSQQAFLEEMLDRIMDTTLDQDPISYLAKSAVDGSHVLVVVTALAVDFCTPFGGEHAGKVGLMMRKVLMDLIRATLDWIAYQPELLLATLAVLTGSEPYWDLWERPLGTQIPEPADLFLTDEIFVRRLLVPAQNRFPHESLPFLKLCRALARSTYSSSEKTSPFWHKILSIDAFTCELPSDFKNYELIREDEDANYIQLTEDFSLVSYRSGTSSMQNSKSLRMSRALTSSSQSSCLQIISKGTPGRVVSEARPFVVLWRWEYHLLEYMGKVLKLASLNDNMSLNSITTLHSRDVVAEIIDLINTMMMSSLRFDPPTLSSQNNVEAARSIIENVSDGLDRNGDLITVVLSIFEDELYRRRKVSEIESAGDILVRCIQFVFTILPVVPDRVWPFLGRSGLLGIDGDESQLSNIVTAIEMATGQYDFLLGCVHVYERLVEDATIHAVSRKTPSKVVTRFGGEAKLGTGVSQAAMRKILLAFTQSMLDVFLSNMHWKFVDQNERLEINSRLCTIFEGILCHCYAIDDSTPPSQKLTESLAPSADYLVDTFLSPNVDINVNPLLHIFTEGLITPNTTLATHARDYRTSQVRAALSLSTTLVHINCLTQSRSGRFQHKLLEASPTLAKLYAAHESYKLPIVQVLEALTKAVAVGDEQPPSILAHLGEEQASHFLEVLSLIDRPFDDVALSVGIWRFLSAIVSQRQQWFAIFVLTGTSPRETFKNRKTADSSPNPEPILTVALDELLHIERLHPQKVLGMLEFVALSADNWPWIMTNIEQHPLFLDALQNFLVNMSSPSSDQSHRFSDYVKIQICSHMVEILASTVRHAQQTGNSSFARHLLPNLSYLTETAVSTPHYNNSLHSKLRQNFESRFSTCFLVNFKRTTLTRPMLGNSFYYNMEIADEMLSFDSAWTSSRGSGFAGEFERANINLSVVEAQVNLLYSWKCLAIQLSRSLASNPDFQQLMIKIVVDCLKSNLGESSTNLAVLEKLAQTRAELAFTLVQRLIEVKCGHQELKQILPATWDTLRKYDNNVETALRGEGSDYYRLLLKTLLLALQCHLTQSTPNDGPLDDDLTTTKPSTSPATTHIVLEIIDLIVARGFRALTILLHDDVSLVQPPDFTLVTAILRTAFLIPGITRNTTQLLTSFADASTARCASSLLSWSDQLATNDDPVYGELSIHFLLELSNVTSLAESLAVEGVVSHITSTNLMKYLRQETVLGPFDFPVRIYRIWSRGLLPLFLNLLHSVGPPIAAEIAGVLNSFPQQLTRASNAFDTDTKSSILTLSITSEAQTLAVITGILDTFRDAGASAGIVSADVAQVEWGRAQVKDDIETWLGKRPVLRDAIVSTTESEELLLRMPAQRKGDADSRLEERIVNGMREVLALLGNGEQ
ncbi:MAG: hypothetical protein HETSPECPRED_000039 [Heterodermia speciosa]|uniref:Nucleoporin n=1 Tax=Heterodermia speciosa TaxID=116794 RepID=A0A8H3ED11_9LECA|nr:MAG: hypothetical protein HETSPECPRED_000039 [Heterodermia speciosa]